MALPTPQHTQYSPMAFFPCYKVVISLAILLLLVFTGSSSAQLSDGFYNRTCPKLLGIVQYVLKGELNKEQRMGASLLRLHFHDCFVQGCDGSVLLDDTPKFGEKGAAPNLNSIRGFEVIDSIKAAVEKECPGVVSCADILALAARESVVNLGGLRAAWDLQLGRRDARRAATKATAANDIPSPTMNIGDLITRFKSLGFTTTDLVALSGAHTIGEARCTNFRDRIYNETYIDGTFKSIVIGKCPRASGSGDNNLAHLDYITSTVFDNNYFKNLVARKGLLHSDQQLHFDKNKWTNALVELYQQNQEIFFRDFANAMKKMSLLSPLTAPNGEIRLNCQKAN